MRKTKLLSEGTSRVRAVCACLGVCLAIVILLSGAMLSISTVPVTADGDVSDYFNISYDPAVFSDSTIVGTEAFSVSIHGTAACVQDLPPVSEGLITGRIVAVHKDDNSRVVLNSRYVLNVAPFPHHQGESADMTVTVPLRFGVSDAVGEYSVIAELIKAEIKIMGAWTDVTENVSSSQALGSISYTPSGVTPTPAPTLSPTPAAAATPATPVLTPSPQPTPTPIATIIPVLPTAELVTDIEDEEPVSWKIDAGGILIQDVNIESNSADVSVDIAAGTRALTSEGIPLTHITIMRENTPSSPDDGYNIIAAFEFTPNGATFNPPITITISYDSEDLPPGTDESDLMVAYFDSGTGLWEYVSLVDIDTEAHTATFSAGHFTVFAVLAYGGSGAAADHVSDFRPWGIGLAATILALIVVAIAVFLRRRRRVAEAVQARSDKDKDRS